MSNNAIFHGLRANGVAVIAAILCLVVMAGRMAGIPADYWQYRDDGIITISHAKNVVTEGHVGVNPSGGIVEGISAPLQAAIAMLAFTVMPVDDYRLFVDGQVIVCTLTLGAFLLWLMRGWAAAEGLPHHWRIGVGGVVAAAMAGASLYQFIAWHNSGMENAITHVLLVGSLAAFMQALVERRIGMAAIMLPALLAIARLDSIIHAFPLACMFALLFWQSTRSVRGCVVPLSVLAVFIAVTAARFAYFGDIYSNTAVAQGLNLSLRARQILGGNPGILDEGARAAMSFVTDYALYLMPVSLGFLVYGRRQPWPIAWQVAALMSSLLGSAMISAWLIGDARLYASRTVSWLGLLTAITVGMVAIRLGKLLQARVLPELTVVGAGTLVSAGLLLVTPAPMFLCCTIPYAEQIVQDIAPDLERRGFVRPMIANPDLGKLSWPKVVNVLDIGSLGDPVLGHLKRSRFVKNDGLLSNDYILGLRQPDLIDFFTATRMCDYRHLVEDPRFLAMYEPYDAARLQGEAKGCSLPPALNYRRWIIRKDVPFKSDELALASLLQRTPRTEHVQEALARCRSSNSCDWVGRAIYRASPELKKAGVLDDIGASVDVLRPASRAVVSSSVNPLWYRAVLDDLKTERLAVIRAALRQGARRFAGEKVNVYSTDEALILDVADRELALAERWFFHAFPAQGTAFVNLDAEATTHTICSENRCFIVLPLAVLSRETRRAGVKAINLGRIDQYGQARLVENIVLDAPVAGARRKVSVK